MHNGRKLDEVWNAIQIQSQAKRDLIADTRDIRMILADGTPKIDVAGHGSTYPTDHCHRQIATWSGIGSRYYEKMRGDSAALLAGNVNHWLHHEGQPARRMVRNMGGIARAFLSDRFFRLDNDRVAKATLEALQDADEVQVASAELTDSRFYLKALFPRTEMEVNVGDAVQAGICVRNSEIGLGSFEVFPFIYTLICTNGMVRMSKTAHGVRRRHLGPRIENDGVIYQQDTLDAAVEGLLLQCRDAVRTFSSREFFETQVTDLRRAREGAQVETPKRAVEVLAKDIGLSESESDAVLENLIRGQDYSRYGMLNAVTRVANTTSDYDRATELESFGGRLLDLQMRQWDRIALAA